MIELMMACLLISAAPVPAAGEKTPPAEVEPAPARPAAAELLAQAQTLAARGALPEAVELLRAAVEDRPEEHALRLGLGDLYLAQKKYQHALNAFSQVLLKDPGRARAASGRALALVGLGDLPKAVIWAKKATEMAPDDLTAWDVLGQVYLSEQYLDAPRAEATYRQLLVLDPGNRRARLQLARALSYEKKIEAAIEQLQSLVAEDPRDWPAQIKLAESYYAIRKMSLARDILLRVLEAKPDDPDAQRLLEAVEDRQAYNFWVPITALIALPILFLLFSRLRKGKKLEA